MMAAFISSLDNADKKLSVAFAVNGNMALTRETASGLSLALQFQQPGPGRMQACPFYNAMSCAVTYVMQHGDLPGHPAIATGPTPRDLATAHVVRYHEPTDGRGLLHPAALDIVGTPAGWVGANLACETADMTDIVWLAQNNVRPLPRPKNDATDPRGQLFGKLYMLAVTGQMNPFHSDKKPQRGPIHAFYH